MLGLGLVLNPAAIFFGRRRGCIQAAVVALSRLPSQLHTGRRHGYIQATVAAQYQLPSWPRSSIGCRRGPVSAPVIGRCLGRAGHRLGHAHHGRERVQIARVFRHHLSEIHVAAPFLFLSDLRGSWLQLVAASFIGGHLHRSIVAVLHCCCCNLLLQLVLLVLQLALHVLSATAGWLSAGARKDFCSVVHYYGGKCSLLFSSGLLILVDLIMSQPTAILINITLDGQNYSEWVFCVETALRGYGLLFI
jgi:hypothetical protein